MSLVLNVVAIASERQPNWLGAEERIAALAFSDLGSYLAYWHPPGYETDALYRSDTYLRSLKSELRDRLGDLQHAVGNYRRDLVRFDFAGSTFYLTGDLFGGFFQGEVPALYDTISSLHAVNALEAAGFSAVSVGDCRIGKSAN